MLQKDYGVKTSKKKMAKLQRTEFVDDHIMTTAMPKVNNDD